MCFVLLGRLFQNLLQLGALIAIKQFLLPHIPLFCENCPISLTAAVQENVSEKTSLCLHLLNDLSCFPACPGSALKLCSILSRYSDICTEHAQQSSTRALYSDNSDLASEGGRMQPSLSWLPQVSYCSLLASVSPSLSTPSQSTSSRSQWPAEDFVIIMPVRENNRGCVLQILLPQSKTLS